MKSKVLNTKHIHETENGWVGYWSELKPSFFRDKEDTTKVWLQFKETNTMASFSLVDVTTGIKDNKEIMVLTYHMDTKFKKRYPEYEEAKFVAYLDRDQPKKVYKYKRLNKNKKK